MLHRFLHSPGTETVSYTHLFKETVFDFACGVKYTLGDAIGDLPRLSAKTLKNSTYVESASWGYTFAGFHATESEYGHLVNMDLPNSLPLLNHRSKYNNERDIQIYETLRPVSYTHLDVYKRQDMNRILQAADIRAIFATGAKAAQLYKKLCFPECGVEAVRLPSTSPANCGCSYETVSYTHLFSIL